MKKLLYLLFAMSVATGLNACSPNDDPTNDTSTETPKTPGNPDPEPDPTPNPDPIRQQERRSLSTTALRTTYIPSPMTCVHRLKPTWCE
ncbi:MAG: hypothetical protein ACLS4S_08250 [Bacteroides nordii]